MKGEAGPDEAEPSSISALHPHSHGLCPRREQRCRCITCRQSRNRISQLSDVAAEFGGRVRPASASSPQPARLRLAETSVYESRRDRHRAQTRLRHPEVPPRCGSRSRAVSPFRLCPARRAVHPRWHVEVCIGRLGPRKKYCARCVQWQNSWPAQRSHRGTSQARAEDTSVTQTRAKLVPIEPLRGRQLNSQGSDRSPSGNSSRYNCRATEVARRTTKHQRTAICP